MSIKMKMQIMKAKAKARKDAKETNAFLKEYMGSGTYKVECMWNVTDSFMISVSIIPMDGKKHSWVDQTKQFFNRPKNVSDEEWVTLVECYRIAFCKKLPVQEFYGSYGNQRTFSRHGFGYDF